MCLVLYILHRDSFTQALQYMCAPTGYEFSPLATFLSASICARGDRSRIKIVVLCPKEPNRCPKLSHRSTSGHVDGIGDRYLRPDTSILALQYFMSTIVHY